MADPKTSVNALFPRGIDCGLDVTVYPMTLAHYALLEKINSYIVNADHAPDSIEVVKSLYICTHSAKETLNEFSNLGTLAFEWAENLPPGMTNLIAEAILKQIDAMSKVVPVFDDGSNKKKRTETDS